MKVKFGHTVASLQRIIQQTLKAMPDATPGEMAAFTLDHHTAEVHAWALQRLTKMYANAQRPGKSPMFRKRPRLGHPGQARIPEFENIPPRIFISGPTKTNKQGARIRLLSATLQDQIISLELTVNQSAEEIAQRRRLIALTRRYDKKQPGITVREVLALQASRSAEAARKRTARARIRTER